MSPLQPVQHHPNHSHSAAHSKPREHLTAMSIFLSVLLAGVLIGLGQRGLYDLNRHFNTYYDACNQAQYLLSGGSSCQVEDYAFKTVVLHSYVSMPLFLIFLFLVLYLRHRRLNTWQRAMFRVSSAVSIFFGVEFLLEVTVYLFQYHRVIAWYFSLGVAAILLMTLVIYVERRQAKKKAAAASAGGH